MNYHTVRDRCAVNFESLNLPISTKSCLSILQQSGFREITCDVVALARTLVGKAEFRRTARFSEAPHIFSCGSFTKWLYAQKGIWLPRLSIQQVECGLEVAHEELNPGDLVFKSGIVNYYRNDPAKGVGHVGLYVGEQTVIHATNRGKIKGVVESSLEAFTSGNLIQSTRRIVSLHQNIHTLLIPSDYEVE